MDTVKRILAIVAIVISIIFIIVCLAGVVFSWSFNGPLTETITRGFTGVERILTAADNGLERVNTNLAEAQAAVDTLEENVQTAGETISETSIIYEVLDRTVGDELFPKVNAARETAAALRNSVVAFNETLEALNDIPLVEVPTLTEDLETASEQLSSIQNDAEELRAELRAIRQEAVSKPVAEITMRTTRMSDRLEAAQSAVTGTQANIDDNLEAVASVKARVPGIFDLISLIFTFVFLWIALGQIGLILLAWGYLKGHSPLEAVQS
jgi:chromosome segregation ATPase